MLNQILTLPFIGLDDSPLPGQIYHLKLEDHFNELELPMYLCSGFSISKKQKEKIVSVLEYKRQNEKSTSYLCIGRMTISQVMNQAGKHLVSGMLIDDKKISSEDFIAAKNAINELCTMALIFENEVDKNSLTKLDPGRLSWLLSSSDALSKEEKLESLQTQSISERLKIFTQALKNLVKRSKSLKSQKLCN